MAFELLEKKWGMNGLANNEVSVSKTAISFGDDFKKPLIENKNVEVYLDRENLKFGFKPIMDTANGYKVQFDVASSKRPSVTSSRITKLIPLGRYKAQLDNGMVVFSVEKINQEK